MARDRYEEHYAEKIWERIPACYRDADGRPANVVDPGGRRQLRGLVEVLAAQAAVLRRSIDRLWDDQFIDLCDDWAVPYIADLVGTRLVSAVDARAQRVDVANTVHYRRRAGTVRLLEQLVSDISGWDSIVVENYTRLGRAWHGRDALPSRHAGMLTGTPRGGVADLRRPVGAVLADGPFDEYAHTPDVRRHRGGDGEMAIQKIAFWLHRLSSLPVTQIRPTRAVNARSFTIDPLGRDTPLFARSDRPVSWDRWERLLPWQTPAPIGCQLLNHHEFDLSPEAVADVAGAGLGLSPAAVTDLESLAGRAYPSRSALTRVLTSLANGAELLAEQPAIESAALVERCGAWGLLSTAGSRLASLRIEVGGQTVPPEQIVAGDLSVWRDPPPGRRVIVDPERGRLRFAGAPGATLRVDLHLGWIGPVGSTTHPRIGLPVPATTRTGGGAFAALVDGQTTEVGDSLTYGPATDVTVTTRTVVQAGDRERPVIVLADDWVFDTGAAVDAELVIDGMWIVGGHDVVLRGDFASVTITRSTLDPGHHVPGDGVGLVVEANVGELRIDHSITGPISVDAAAVVGVIEIADSIVEPDDPTDPGSPSVDAPRTTLDIARSTVLGTTLGQRIWATDSLFVGQVDITDIQSGCFRFSAAPDGSRLAHPYESATTPSAELFTTTTFPLPGYCQLLTGTDPVLFRGAENGSQMGAFSSLLEPIKFDSIRTKIAEYLPIGRHPIYQFVT